MLNHIIANVYSFPAYSSWPYFQNRVTNLSKHLEWNQENTTDLNCKQRNETQKKLHTNALSEFEL